MLENLRITVGQVRAEVVRIDGSGQNVKSGHIPFTPSAKQVFRRSLDEALSLDHDYIGSEHLLLGLVDDRSTVGARILLDLDVDAEKVRREVHRFLGLDPPPLGPTQEAQPAARFRSREIEAMPYDTMTWREKPDWLRTSRRHRLWVRSRVTLHRSLGIPLPTYVAHNGAPIGPRRIFRRISRRRYGDYSHR